MTSSELPTVDVRATLFLNRQIDTFSTSDGMRYHSGFAPFVASRMNRAQAGTATTPANPPRMMGAGWSRPNHTPVRRCGV